MDFQLTRDAEYIFLLVSIMLQFFLVLVEKIIFFEEKLPFLSILERWNISGILFNENIFFRETFLSVKIFVDQCAYNFRYVSWFCTKLNVLPEKITHTVAMKLVYDGSLVSFEITTLNLNMSLKLNLKQSLKLNLKLNLELNLKLTFSLSLKLNLKLKLNLNLNLNLNVSLNVDLKLKLSLN